jgi:uncharacterized protein
VAAVKIVVDHIKETPLVIPVDEQVEAFPLLKEIQNDKSFCVTGKIQGELVVTREFGNIRVVGRITVPLTLSCSRCLESYASCADSSFTVIYQKNDAGVIPAEDVLELGESDLICTGYTGDEIDLTHEIEEQLAMEIPLKPLCSETCKGLCHECGIDLNMSKCSCSKKTASLAFSVLKDFKVSK